MNKAEAYEIAADWHDKNARLFSEMSKDEPRTGDDARKKAADASIHHAGSAAALRLAALNLRRSALESSECRVCGGARLHYANCPLAKPDEEVYTLSSFRVDIAKAA